MHWQDSTGQWVPASVDSNGNLKVAVTGAGSGGTSSPDETAFTPGTSVGTPAMGVVSPSDTPPAGELAVVALDANRAMKVNVVAGGAGGGAATIADGADVAQGTTTDAADTSGATGTLMSKIRGLVQLFAKAFNLATPLRIDPTNATTMNVNQAQVAGQTPALNAGTSGAGTPRVVEATAAVANISQVSVGATATLILAANPNRIKLRITNVGTTAVYIGGSGVAVATGDLLPGIAGFPWYSRFEGAVYGIAATGSQTVTVYEESAS
jgi:hypothetical protein